MCHLQGYFGTDPQLIGILNAIFVPFISHFEVQPSLVMMWQFSLQRTQVLQEPAFNQRSRIHPLCTVEVPGIQQASPPV